MTRSDGGRGQHVERAAEILPVELIVLRPAERNDLSGLRRGSGRIA
jgi:hypothetical protein